MLPLLLAFGEDPAWRARHALAYAFAPLARGLDVPAALRAAYAKLMTDPEAEVRAAAALHVAEAVDATRAPGDALDGLAPAVDALSRDVSASVRAALAQRAAEQTASTPDLGASTLLAAIESLQGPISAIEQLLELLRQRLDAPGLLPSGLLRCAPLGPTSATRTPASS